MVKVELRKLSVLQIDKYGHLCFFLLSIIVGEFCYLCIRTAMPASMPAYACHGGVYHVSVRGQPGAVLLIMFRGYIGKNGGV